MADEHDSWFEPFGFDPAQFATDPSNEAAVAVADNPASGAPPDNAQPTATDPTPTDGPSQPQADAQTATDDQPVNQTDERYAMGENSYTGEQPQTGEESQSDDQAQTQTDDQTANDQSSDDLTQADGQTTSDDQPQTDDQLLTTSDFVCARNITSGVYRTWKRNDPSFKRDWKLIHDGPCQCEGKTADECQEPGDDFTSAQAATQTDEHYAMGENSYTDEGSQPDERYAMGENSCTDEQSQTGEQAQTDEQARADDWSQTIEEPQSDEQSQADEQYQNDEVSQTDDQAQTQTLDEIPPSNASTVRFSSEHIALFNDLGLGGLTIRASLGDDPCFWPKVRYAAAVTSACAMAGTAGALLIAPDPTTISKWAAMATGVALVGALAAMVTAYGGIIDCMQAQADAAAHKKEIEELKRQQQQTQETVDKLKKAIEDAKK